MKSAVGERLFCDSSTIVNILENTVSLLSLDTLIVNVPVPLMVEPKTISPTFFSRGILSPFMVDSSMLV